MACYKFVSISLFLSGGTAMLALLALAGDFGCSVGPTAVGFVANTKGGNLSDELVLALIFPMLLIIGLIILTRLSRE